MGPFHFTLATAKQHLFLSAAQEKCFELFPCLQSGLEAATNHLRPHLDSQGLMCQSSDGVVSFWCLIVLWRQQMKLVHKCIKSAMHCPIRNLKSRVETRMRACLRRTLTFTTFKLYEL